MRLRTNRNPIPMTDTATEPLPASTVDAWAQQLAQLRVRYKHLREPVLVALCILVHDPDVDLDDAKARAAMHGVRITAASVNAARTVLAKMGSPSEPSPTTAPRATRRVRAAQVAPDAESLVREFVGKLQRQGDAEVERMREAIRKSVALLQAAVASPE